MSFYYIHFTLYSNKVIFNIGVMNLILDEHCSYIKP